MPLILLWPAHREERAVAGAELDHDGVVKRAVRDAVEEHHPTRLPPAFPPPGVGDVHRLVAAPAGVLRGGEGGGADSGVVGEDAVAAARRIVGAGEAGEEGGAEDNPPGVDEREALPIHRVIIAAP